MGTARKVTAVDRGAADGHGLPTADSVPPTHNSSYSVWGW